MTKCLGITSSEVLQYAQLFSENYNLKILYIHVARNTQQISGTCSLVRTMMSRWFWIGTTVTLVRTDWWWSIALQAVHTFTVSVSMWWCCLKQEYVKSPPSNISIARWPQRVSNLTYAKFIKMLMKCLSYQVAFIQQPCNVYTVSIIISSNQQLFYQCFASRLGR